MKHNKEVRAPNAPPTGAVKKRVPPTPLVHEDENKCSPSWMFSALDWLGPWGWGKLDAATLTDVHKRLCDLEKMRWSEVANCAHAHPMKTQVLEKEARDRLAQLKLDDVEELYQLGFGNKPRIWGVRHGRVYSLLWYDPEHTVYRTPKRNT